MWRPDQREVGFDLGIAAEDVMEAAGLRVYCDGDPFRVDCMRVVLRRLEGMTRRDLNGPRLLVELDGIVYNMILLVM